MEIIYFIQLGIPQVLYGPEETFETLHRSRLRLEYNMQNYSDIVRVTKPLAELGSYFRNHLYNRNEFEPFHNLIVWEKF